MDEITHGSFFLNVQLCTQLLIVGLQGTKKTLKTNLTSINFFFVLATEANNRKEKVCLFISSWSILAGWDDGSHWAHQTTCEGKVAFKSASLLV